MSVCLKMSLNKNSYEGIERSSGRNFCLAGGIREPHVRFSDFPPTTIPAPFPTLPMRYVTTVFCNHILIKMNVQKYRHVDGP